MWLRSLSNLRKYLHSASLPIPLEFFQFQSSSIAPAPIPLRSKRSLSPAESIIYRSPIERKVFKGSGLA